MPLGTRPLGTGILLGGPAAVSRPPATPAVTVEALTATRVRVSAGTYSHPTGTPQALRTFRVRHGAEVLIEQDLPAGTEHWDSPELGADLSGYVAEVRDTDQHGARSEWGSETFGTFDPVALGPHHWHRADSEVVVADGDQANWPDARGISPEVLGWWQQRDSLPRPRWYEDVVGGRPVFRFDRSVGSVFRSGAWESHFTGDFTLLLVHKTDGDCTIFSRMGDGSPRLDINGDPGTVRLGTASGLVTSQEFFLPRSEWQLTIVRRESGEVTFYEGLAPRGTETLVGDFRYDYFGRHDHTNTGHVNGDVAEVQAVARALSAAEMRAYAEYVEGYYAIELLRGEFPDAPGPVTAQYLGAGLVRVTALAGYTHPESTEQLGRSFRLRDGSTTLAQVQLPPGATSYVFDGVSDPVGLIAGARDEDVAGGRSLWAEADPIPDSPAPPAPLTVEHLSGTTWRLHAAEYAHPTDAEQEARHWRVLRDSDEHEVYAGSDPPDTEHHDADLSGVATDTLLRWGAADEDEHEVTGPYAELLAPRLAAPLVSTSGLASRSVNLNATGSATHPTRIRRQLRRADAGWEDAWYDSLDAEPATGTRQLTVPVLLPGHAYVYRARQEVPGLIGPWSSEVPFTTPAEVAQSGELVRTALGVLWDLPIHAGTWVHFLHSPAQSYDWPTPPSGEFSPRSMGFATWGWGLGSAGAVFARSHGGSWGGVHDPVLTHEGWLRPMVEPTPGAVHQVDGYLHSVSGQKPAIRLYGLAWRSGPLLGSSPESIHDAKLDDGEGKYLLGVTTGGHLPDTHDADPISGDHHLIDVVGVWTSFIIIRRTIGARNNILTVRGVPAGLVVRLPSLRYLQRVHIQFGSEIPVEAPPLEVVSVGDDIEIDLSVYRFPVPRIEIREPSDELGPGALHVAADEWIYGGDEWAYGFEAPEPPPIDALRAQAPTDTYHHTDWRTVGFGHLFWTD